MKERNPRATLENETIIYGGLFDIGSCRRVFRIERWGQAIKGRTRDDVNLTMASISEYSSPWSYMKTMRGKARG